MRRVSLKLIGPVPTDYDPLIQRWSITGEVHDGDLHLYGRVVVMDSVDYMDIAQGCELLVNDMIKKGALI